MGINLSPSRSFLFPVKSMCSEGMGTRRVSFSPVDKQDTRFEDRVHAELLAGNACSQAGSQGSVR